MNAAFKLFGAAIVFAVCGNFAAAADTFTAPLNLSIQTGDGGQYLSADFDFHTAFSTISSLTLHFSMPDGYQGNATASGYSFYSAQLWIDVHSSDSAPSFGYNLVDPNTGPIYAFKHVNSVWFDVPAGGIQEADFYPPVVVDTDPPSYLGWPDSIYSGIGGVAMTDYNSQTMGSGPLFPPGSGTSTISWLLPGEVTDASITIVGTAVPEPATVVLLLLGCAGMARRRRK